MRVTRRPERVDGPGDTFYESPADVHVVSASASHDKAARFPADFVCDHKTPLSVPVPGAASPESGPTRR